MEWIFDLIKQNWSALFLRIFYLYNLNIWSLDQIFLLKTKKIVEIEKSPWKNFWKTMLTEVWKNQEIQFS